MTLDHVPDARPPVALPFGSSYQLPAFRTRLMREGAAIFREMAVPIFAESAFFKIWKPHSLEFKERGFTVKAHDGKWTLSQWLLPDPADKRLYTLTPIGQDIVDQARGATELDLQPVAVELEALPSELEDKLYDYQIDPARQLLRALRNGQSEWGYPGAWDCSDLGTGKTFQALAAAIATGLEVFVICPLSVIGAMPYHGGRGSGWRGAFAHFNQHPRGIYNYETLRTGKRDFVKIEKYRGDHGPMRRFNWTLDPKDTILIFDEAHRMKRPGTQNQGLAMAAMRQGFPTIYISGTLASDPTHMRASGRAVGLHKGTDYPEFLQHNGCLKTGNTWKFMGGTRGRRILSALHHQVFPARGARTRIQDLGDRFPETSIIAEAFETGETQKIAQAFREAEYAIERLRQQGDKDEATLGAIRQSAYMRAWHESERLKVPMLVEKIEDEIEQGRSVAVFVNFTDVRQELMQKLKAKCGIYGGQPHHERSKAIDDFQNDKERVIVCNIAAGGVGVSLHDLNGTYPRTAFILPSNKAEDIKQALGRVHRAGGMSPSRQVIIFAAGTVEVGICNAVRARIANMASLNDGDIRPDAAF